MECVYERTRGTSSIAYAGALIFLREKLYSLFTRT